MKGQILGDARGRPASLEVNGDTLIWRADDNVATTIHEIKQVHFLLRRFDRPGAVLAAVALLVMTDYLWAGVALLALAVPLLVRRVVRPVPWLVLLVGDRRLMMRVATGSATLARALTDRIRQALATGEVASTPPALP